MGQAWLEVKVREKGVTSKVRRPVPAPDAQRLRRRALATVTYQRTAYEGDGWRVTFDRGVSCQRIRLPLVVVEVKGDAPKWILKALGKPRKKFSKSRWALGRLHKEE